LVLVNFTSLNTAFADNVDLLVGPTIAPVMTSPQNNSIFKTDEQIDFSFIIPEAPLPNSVKITFAPSTEQGETFVLTLNHESILPATPTNLILDLDTPILDIGLPIITVENTNNLTIIPVGIYTVTLSYQNISGAPAASTIANNVVITDDETAPVLTTLTEIPAQVSLEDAIYEYSISEVCDVNATELISNPVDEDAQLISTDTTSNSEVVHEMSVENMDIGTTYSFSFICLDSAGNQSNELVVGPFTIIDPNARSTNRSSSSGGSKVTKKEKVVNDVKDFPFTDLEGSFAEEAVRKLWSLGVVNGRTETEFAPNYFLLRAEALKIALNAFGHKLDADLSGIKRFVDTQDLNVWYAPFLAKALDLKVIEGYSDSTFRPEEIVSRAEMLKIFFTAAGIEIESTDLKVPFTDVPKTAWYHDLVATAYKLGIVNGRDTVSFEPDMSISRAEAAMIAVRIMELD
jgi:hypothetical protein